jgi:Spy/CpxP family protein refolding chaperone
MLVKHEGSRNRCPFPTSSPVSMKHKYFLVPVLAMLGFGGLQAQNVDSTASPIPGYEHHPHGRHHDAWIWKKLNLTDAQKTQIKSIKQGLRGQTRPALAAVLTAKIKLQQDIDANSEKGLIAADAAALATAESQFAAVRATELSQIKAILTDEQQTTWSDFQKKRQARMQNWIDKLNQPTT